MKQFTRQHEDRINGVISGFDRLVFRGSLRTLSHKAGMKLYLSRVGVLLKEFGHHVQALSTQVKEATQTAAEAMGRKVLYLASAKADKEAVAREIMVKEKIAEGPVCILSTVEVCRSYELYRNRETKRLELEPRWRKCLFYYHYWIDPEFGFMNARIQTWMPFPIQVCLNGREWLSRQMEAKGLSYVRRENCFVWLEDPDQAQRLLDQQLRAAWPKLLDRIAHRLNPAHQRMFRDFPIAYYWCVYQSEWATDVLFRDPETLARLYPRFVHHGVTSFASPDVMRFLGKKVPDTGRIHGRFKGQVITSLKHRPEGVRIKHSVNGNAIKLYDKQGSVLRVETTINDHRDIKVYRRKEGQPPGPSSWQKMRKGIADLHRRTQVSQTSNERYLEALAAVSDDTTLGELIETLCRPVHHQGKRIRALRPWNAQELQLLQLLNRGEFLITGFRNRDVASLLFPTPPNSPDEIRRRAAAISYRLRILRAHGLLAKIPHTHRYRVTSKGRKAITAILAAHRATITQLTECTA